MTDLHWTNCTVRLGDLKPWADNPRFSTKAQAKRILDSFRRFDQVLPIAIGPANEVYDGHQRLSALLTIHGPSHEIDARRSNRALTDDERRALTLAINGGAVGAWNWDALAGWDTDVLKGEGFDKDMLADLNASAANLAAMLVSEVDAGDAFGALPSEDRAPFQQMTFTLHDEQAATVRAALRAATELGPFVNSQNENSNGNALARICEMFSDGNR